MYRRQATETADQLWRALYIDPSGLWSRHALHSRPLDDKRVVLFFDLDHFKIVVDRVGHLRAGQVLAAVARLIYQRLRPDEDGFIYAGDEFVVLVPWNNRRTRARELQTFLGTQQFPFGVRLTISVGIGSQLAVADRALFAAKAAGRNSIIEGPDLRLLGQLLSPILVEYVLRAW